MAVMEDKALQARVYCPICTHTVEADVTPVARGWNQKLRVVRGQKCSRCEAVLDAAYVLNLSGGLSG